MATRRCLHTILLIDLQRGDHWELMHIGGGTERNETSVISQSTTVNRDLCPAPLGALGVLSCLGAWFL